jgi:hypothetical protein
MACSENYFRHSSLFASPLFAQFPPPCGAKECFIGFPVNTHCFKCILGTDPDIGCTVINCHQCDSTCTSGAATKKGASQYLQCASTAPEFLEAMSKPSNGLHLWRIHTPGAPAVLEAVFQSKGPILSGRIANLGTTPIVSYRLGWLEATSNGHRRVVMGKRISTTPIKPLASKKIQRQGPIAPSLPKTVKGIAFFVAEVRFADGRRWNIDLDSLSGNQVAAAWEGDFRARIR